MNDLEITPAETKRKLERGDGVLLVDVREPWEFEICRIEGAKLIPMGTVPANLQALAVLVARGEQQSRSRPSVLLCSTLLPTYRPLKRERSGSVKTRLPRFKVGPRWRRL